MSVIEFTDNEIGVLQQNLYVKDIEIDTMHKQMNYHKDILTEDAFIYSDQGVHYTSPLFQKVVKNYRLGQSMSRRGNCCDYAPQESFFGHF